MPPPRKRRSVSLRSCLLPAFTLLHQTQAYQPNTGSSVSGNLLIAAPYGIPPNEFGNVTRRLTSSATFNITGYDVSSNAGSRAPDATPGWTLTAGVTADVSLIDASPSSKLDSEATTLFMQPPGGTVTVDPSWRICVVVYTGLAEGVDVSGGTVVDGTCGDVLSGECVQAIQRGTSGIDNNGDCADYVLPSACTSEFPAESINSTAFAINQTVLDAKRFYAYGSPQTQTSDEVAIREAQLNIWPVITLFSQLSGANGTVTSLSTAVQCVRALNGTATAPVDPVSGSGAVRLFETGVNGLALLLLGVFVCLNWT